METFYFSTVLSSRALLQKSGRDGSVGFSDSTGFAWILFSFLSSFLFFKNGWVNLKPRKISNFNMRREALVIFYQSMGMMHVSVRMGDCVMPIGSTFNLCALWAEVKSSPRMLFYSFALKYAWLNQCVTLYTIGYWSHSKHPTRIHKINSHREKEYRAQWNRNLEENLKAW